jgi:hypothetical protein
MKAEGKWLEIKARIRAAKEHKRRIVIAVFSASILLFVAASAYFNSPLSNTGQVADKNPQQTTNRAFSFKAAIIDHLSISDPSPGFIEEAEEILRTANFTVDYYPRDQVTIDFYKKLAALDYGLIIFRVHSGREPTTFFFSGETYSTNEYVPEQLTDQVRQGQLPDETLTYFSINPRFVKYSMKGSFYKTVIIAMGCASLRITDMAEAFVKKGASVYMGWNASIYSIHGDFVTLGVIRHLLLENQTVTEAVNAAMEEIGPCQVLETGTTSVLSFYPLSSESLTVPRNEQ